MKTIPPPCPEPEVGHKYWRSLDELAKTPEFNEWVEREFPAGASELTDPVTRRHFMQIMSASFLLAGVGLTGCRRPVEHIYPFAKMPEGYVHGKSKFYATAMPARNGAIPLLARSDDGRPTKVEGNPQHPQRNGGTDVYAQASILNLYDPDRAMRYTRDGNQVTREAALDGLLQLSRESQANGGKGMAFLLEKSSSPSRLRLENILRERLPQARWFAYEPVDFEVKNEAALTAFGQAVVPSYRFDEARIVVSLDSDFLGSEEDCYLHSARFARGRKLAAPTDTMNRLYAVEGLFTLTGANADHRLRVSPSSIVAVAARLGSEIFTQTGQADMAAGLQRLAGGAAAHEKWIVECAKDLLANRAQGLVVAGHRQPLAVQLIAQAINAALGSVGTTVVYLPNNQPPRSSIAELAQALAANEIQTLVISAGNLGYNAPANLDLPGIIRRVRPHVIRLGYYEDETFELSTWHFPAAHYLESWGDVRTSDGTVTSIQPLIEPLFGGITELELLARIAGRPKPSSYEVVRETIQDLIGGNEDDWNRFLHNGYLENTALQPLQVQLNPGEIVRALASVQPAQAPARDRLEVVFHRDYRLDDGRYANNGWLMELPDPITKITWENVILMSSRTAQELGLEIIDRENNRLLVPWIQVQLNGKQIEGPAWIQPGLADYTLALSLGYGQAKSGRIGRGLGYNAYTLRTAPAMYLAEGAQVTATNRTHELACTQNHWALEGRPIIREATLDQFKKHPDFAKSMDFPAPPSTEAIYANPLDQVESKALHQWGMSIDLNSCVGCSACMVACQSENNVPIVGKDQVRRGREMHWLRIDRYYAGALTDPQMLTQPMLCQHCEKAPCENVCPVNATVHDHEGLNLMVYNRCVGTRYCSNNCPYKIRRFNYFDYNKRPLNALYRGPLATRPDDELTLAKLAKNPDVTVRMRGVMEKCTFCVQRIEAAKIAQKVKAGPSGDVVVPRDSFTTACAQACPTDAIVFGNIADPNSRVTQLKMQGRDYAVLDFLATKPRLTYLAKVRNPNPAMPDAYDMPASFRDYSNAMGGNPLETHSAVPSGNVPASNPSATKGAH